MEALALHTGKPIVHLDDRTSFISIVESKRVTLRVKHIDIRVNVLQEHFANFFVKNIYKKSRVVSADMCTKPCSGPIISCNTKWITELRLYPTSDI